MSEKQKRVNLIKGMIGLGDDKWISITPRELKSWGLEVLEEFKSSRKRGRPKKK